MSVRLLRLPQVKERVGLSRTQIYRLIKLGEFPPSIPITARAVAWRSDEIDAWVDQRITATQDAKE